MSIPTDIPGLVLWGDASQLSYSSGASVPSVTDLSGAGHTLTTLAGRSSPTFLPDAHNGRGVLMFDGSATLQSVFALAQPYTLIAAWKATSIATLNVAFDGITAQSGWLNYYANQYRQSIYSNGADLVYAPAHNGWWAVSRAVYNGGSSSLSVNGAAAVTSPPDIGSTAPGGITIGSNGGGGIPGYLQAGEWAVWSRVLDGTELAAMYAYFNNKWHTPVAPALVSTVGHDLGYQHALAYQGGKILHAGYAIDSATTPLALTTCNADLSGPVTTLGAAFGTEFNTDPQYTREAFQSDGKVVRSGYDLVSGTHRMVVARYNADTTLDTGFGTGGKTSVVFPGAVGSWANAVAVLPSGKILAAGCDQSAGSYQSGAATGQFAVAQLTSAGALDTAGFGSGAGLVTIDLDGQCDQVNAMAVDATSGKITLTGLCGPTVNAGVLGIVRLNADGGLDTTFGTGGKAVTSYALDRDRAHAMAVDADGKVIASGGSFHTVYGFQVARFGTDGNLDATFGAAGIKNINFGTNNEACFDLKVLASGKIVAGGWMMIDLARYNIALARLNGADGGLDTTFGEGGQVVTDLGTDDDECFAVAPVGTDLAVGGFSHTGGIRFDPVLVLYDDAGNPIAPASSAVASRGCLLGVGG